MSFESLGFNRSEEVQKKINEIIKNKEPFLAIKELQPDCYTILNRISGKYITEYTYDKEGIEIIFEQLI